MKRRHKKCKLDLDNLIESMRLYKGLFKGYKLDYNFIVNARALLRVFDAYSRTEDKVTRFISKVRSIENLHDGKLSGRFIKYKEVIERYTNIYLETSMDLNDAIGISEEISKYDIHLIFKHHFRFDKDIAVDSTEPEYIYSEDEHNTYTRVINKRVKSFIHNLRVLNNLRAWMLIYMEREEKLKWKID